MGKYMSLIRSRRHNLLSISASFRTVRSMACKQSVTRVTEPLCYTCGYTCSYTCSFGTIVWFNLYIATLINCN